MHINCCIISQFYTYIFTGKLLSELSIKLANTLFLFYNYQTAKYIWIKTTYVIYIPGHIQVVLRLWTTFCFMETNDLTKEDGITSVREIEDSKTGQLTDLENHLR